MCSGRGHPKCQISMRVFPTMGKVVFVNGLLVNAYGILSSLFSNTDYCVSQNQIMDQPTKANYAVHPTLNTERSGRCQILFSNIFIAVKT